MKRVFLIHGWGGNSNNCWFPWLKEHLEQKGFEVTALAMPNPDEPNVQTWPKYLLEHIENPDTDTYLVGHSIGCQSILRFLEQLPIVNKVGGIVLVAPFFKLLHLQTEEEKNIARPWEENIINLEKVKQQTNNIVAIFSDDDPDVDFDYNAPLFEKELRSKIIVEHGKGHFSDDDGVTELPAALEELLRIARTE